MTHVHRHQRLGTGARIPAAVFSGIVALIIMRKSGKRGMAMISTVSTVIASLSLPPSIYLSLSLSLSLL
jgi:hypothetical protein